MVLFKELRPKLAYPVPRYVEFDVAVTGAESFLAVSVAAVVCVFYFCNRTWNNRVYYRVRPQGRSP